MCVLALLMMVGRIASNFKKKKKASIKMHSSKIIRFATTKINHLLHSSYPASFLKLEEKNPVKILHLPQKQDHVNKFIGDISINQAPISDFRKTNPLYCFAPFQLINSNLIPQHDWKHQDSALENVPFLNRLPAIYLPTLQIHTNEKRADYYRHRDPRRFTHLTWIRHRQMKKHQRNKWRKKNLGRIKRIRLERNIAKEKAFRAELLAQIKAAEDFDPRTYVENILHTIDNVPKAETPLEKLERYKDLIRKNRTQTNLVMPKFEKTDR